MSKQVPVLLRFVPGVFASEKLKWHHPVGIPIRSRRSICEHFVKIRWVRVIGLHGAPGMGFHSREIARLVFSFEPTKVTRPNQPLLYFFQHHDLAPGYGGTEENP